MNGVIANFRRGRKTVKNNQIIVELEGVSTKKDASKLAGKKVVWTTIRGKKLIGTITQPHGAKGAVRARFEKGLPGQCIGTPIKAVD